MALLKGWATVPRLWFSQTIDNCFEKSRSRQVRDFLVWLVEQAAIGDYKDLKRGELRFTTREAARIFRVSKTTIGKWLRWLVSRGFICLNTKVTRSRVHQTLVTVVDYPPVKAKGDQSKSGSIIEGEKKKQLKPLPLFKGTRDERSKSRFLRNTAKAVTKKIFERSRTVAEIRELSVGEKADELVIRSHGSYQTLCNRIMEIIRKHRPYDPQSYATAYLRRKMEKVAC
jgi:hypothetical protein